MHNVKMAAAPAGFSFVFGISETPLTQALERRNYDEALHYIDIRYGVCLDEGYYRRTPLFIVLSGEHSVYDGKAMPVHLKLARKLIEKGADPNLRIPVSHGAEYVSPGRSPLECVVDFYNLLTSRYKPMTSDHIIPSNQAISVANNVKTSVQDLTEELIDLAWMLLGHGAEVDVHDAENKTPLHNTILKSCDVRMAQVLIDNGADVNAVDRFANTPLMSLCSPMPWGEDEEVYLYGPGISGFDIGDTLHYLLRFDNIKINHCGIHGRTALFYTMQSGNFNYAKMLLDHGANPSIRGMGPDGRYVSPLLAALIPWSSQDRNNVTTTLASLSPLIDNSYLSTPEILKEILEYTMGDQDSDPLLPKLVYKGVKLIELLFGQTSCHLTQLTARNCLKTYSIHMEQNFDSMTSYDIVSIVRAQGLPSELFTHLQIALLREKIISTLAEADWDEWDLEEYSLNDSDDYDESDDEFW